MSEFNIRFQSKYLSAPMDVVIVTPVPEDGVDPESYYNDKTIEYPVVYLLESGYSGFSDGAVYTANPRRAIERNCIFVHPHAPNSDYANQDIVGEGFGFEDFFIKELVPFVKNWFHGTSDPKKTLLCGPSMGCAATWRYGLAHPDVFGTIAPFMNQPLDYSFLEPYRDMTAKEFREYASNNHVPTAYGIDLGRMHAKELGVVCRYDTVGGFLDSMENTWTRFVEAAEAGKLPNIFFIGAEEKKWGSGITKFREYCEANNLDVAFDLNNEGPTTHSTVFMEIAFERFLEYAGFKKVNTTLS